MSEQAAPEPTMEEILASIRRIISEDDAPQAEAEAAPPPQAAAPEPAPEPPPPEPVAQAAPEPAPEPEPDEDVLELTQRVEPEPETVGDLELVKPEPAPASLGRQDDDSLVSLPSAFAAASAFGQLSAAVAMPAGGRTLEDVVRELLRPLLKAWLDEHLPRIVEAKVAEEVERISRSRVR
jgi:cell pole-organizing protein PopZ